MIDEDGAHDPRSDGEKMRAILPVLARLLLRQADIRLIDQRGGLQRVTLALAPELSRRDAAQLGIDRFNQSREGAGVAVGPVVQQPRDVTWGFWGQGTCP